MITRNEIYDTERYANSVITRLKNIGIEGIQVTVEGTPSWMVSNPNATKLNTFLIVPQADEICRNEYEFLIQNDLCRTSIWGAGEGTNNRCTLILPSSNTDRRNLFHDIAQVTYNIYPGHLGSTEAVRRYVDQCYSNARPMFMIFMLDEKLFPEVFISQSLNAIGGDIIYDHSRQKIRIRSFNDNAIEPVIKTRCIDLERVFTLINLYAGCYENNPMSPIEIHKNLNRISELSYLIPFLNSYKKYMSAVPESKSSFGLDNMTIDMAGEIAQRTGSFNAVEELTDRIGTNFQLLKMLHNIFSVEEPDLTKKIKLAIRYVASRPDYGYARMERESQWCLKHLKAFQNDLREQSYMISVLNLLFKSARTSRLSNFPYRSKKYRKATRYNSHDILEKILDDYARLLMLNGVDEYQTTGSLTPKTEKSSWLKVIRRLEIHDEEHTISYIKAALGKEGKTCKKARS